MEIYFVTGNEGKYQEAKEIIPDLAKIDLDLEEIQGIDPKVIIEHKLKQALTDQKRNLIVEDTSFYLSCLKGLPGPLIKWFMKTIGNDGLIGIANSFGDNSAEAKVIIGFAKENGEINFFEGAIKGKIVSARGENGFGWDPIFQPEGNDKTFAEMSLAEKNQISMRKIAFQKLNEFLNQS